MTDKTVVNAITAVAAVVAGVSGIKSAPTYPREQMSESPFAVTYLTNGIMDVGPIGTRKNMVNIAIDLLLVRRDIALDLAILLPFCDSIPLALLAEVSGSGDIFSGNIDTFESVATEFLPSIFYGDVQMLGYRFTMNNVKLQVSL